MKNLFLLAILAISFVACQQKDYKIDVQIEGLKEGKAILQKIVDGRPSPVDTAEIVEGVCSFAGSVDEPQVYLIFVDDNQAPLVFFAENKNFSISVKDITKPGELEITGSPINDIYMEFTQNIPGMKRYEELQAEYQKAMMAGDKETMEALKAEGNEIAEETNAYFIDFIKNNTDNVVGANMAMQAVREFDFAEFKELVAQFETSLGEHQYVGELKKVVEAREKEAEAEKATEVGAIAPDFTLESINGENLALSSLKGKYILVDFWASWCGPCRAENPNVVKAYETYKSKGFDVLGVSLDRDTAAWKKAVEDDGLTWNLVIDGKGDIATTYGVKGIPFTLLLDKEGKIVAKNLRGPALEEKLAELLN